MQLAALMTLAATALAAQPTLPPWRLSEAPGAPADLAPSTSAGGPVLRVQLRRDGSFQVRTARGGLWMRSGLPGRPLKVWRDGGHPVQDPWVPLEVASATPLTGSGGALPVGERDLRQRFTGLVWILDDSESVLTVLHPAARRQVSLRLPDVAQASLAWFPDRLVVTGHAQEGGQLRTVTWELHWVALLPCWVELARLPRPAPLGTALEPFVRE